MILPSTDLRHWMALCEDRSTGQYDAVQAKEIGDCAVVAISALTGQSWDAVFAIATPYFTRYGLNSGAIWRVMQALGWDTEQVYWKLMGLSGTPMTVRAAESYLKQNDPEVRLLCTITVAGVRHATAFVDGEFKNAGSYRARIREARVCKKLAAA